MAGLIRRILRKSAGPLLAGGLVLGSVGACSNVPSEKLEGGFPEPTPATLVQTEDVLLDAIEKDSRVVMDASDYSVDDNDFTRSPDRPVIQFLDSPVQKWVNYLYDMMRQDYAAYGISMPGIEGIDLSIISPGRMHGICGDEAGACNGNSHIYMPDNSNLHGFYATIFHEIGHTNFSGAGEYPSKANEVVMNLKSYQFSRRIGSLMLDSLFSNFGRYPLEKYSPFIQMYAKGSMYAVHALISFNGSPELAMDYIAHSKTIILETDLREKLDELPGPTDWDRYFQLWNELLDTTGFTDNMASPTGHLDIIEAWELTDFLRILNYSINLEHLTDKDIAAEELAKLCEQFINSSYNTNPFFRAKTIWSHTEHLRQGLWPAVSEHGIDSSEVFNLGQHIVDINSAYPCEATNVFECPMEMREARYAHVDGYYYMLQSSFMAMDDPIRKKIASEYTIDFIERFYPGADFHSNDFEALSNSNNEVTDNLVPVFAGWAAHTAIVDGDYDLARKFYNAAVAMTCKDIGFHINRQSCENARSDAQYILSYLNLISGN